MNPAKRAGRSGAEDWLRTKDAGVRVIAAEMAENAARINLLWALTLDAVASDPDVALSRLVDIQILLEIPMPLEIEDLLAVVTEGCARLAAGLPDT